MKFKLIVILLFSFLLLSCGKPVPAEKLSYVGDWQSKEMNLLILQDGSVSYKRLKNGSTVTLNGPIKEFNGDNFSVGILFLNTTFYVTEAPVKKGNTWMMTVDGVRLTKHNPDASTSYDYTVQQIQTLLKLSKSLHEKTNIDKKYFSQISKNVSSYKTTATTIHEALEGSKKIDSLSRVRTLETRFFENSNTILRSQENVIYFNSNLTKFESLIPDFITQTDEMIDLTARGKVNAYSVYILTRQLFLFQRLKTNIEILKSGTATDKQYIASMDRIGRDTVLIIRVMTDSSRGNKKLRIPKVTNKRVRAKLISIIKNLLELRTIAGNLLERSPQLFEYEVSKRDLIEITDSLQEEYLQLLK